MKKFRDIVSKDKVSGFEASARNSIANRKQLDEEFELKLKKLTEEKVMKKQTAVEWLIEELGEYFPHEIGGIHLMVKKAKAMEKQQLIKSYMHVKEETEQVWLYDDLEREFANDYYEELYGKQDSN